MYIQCMLLMRISGSKKLKLIDETDQKDQIPSRFTWEHIIRVQLLVFPLSLLRLEIPKKIFTNAGTLLTHNTFHMLLIILSQQPLHSHCKESPP